MVWVKVLHRAGILYVTISHVTVSCLKDLVGDGPKDYLTLVFLQNCHGWKHTCVYATTATDFRSEFSKKMNRNAVPV